MKLDIPMINITVKNIFVQIICLLCLGQFTTLEAQEKRGIEKPWKNGKLSVSKENRYLVNGKSTPFFWLGDTGWLLPERLDRDEVNYYLSRCSLAGYNVVQVQTMNDAPAINIYGQYSLIDGFNFDAINQKGVYGYWDHMDYIVRSAEQQGIYIAMVCVWGSVVKSGKMNVAQAEAYGKFLGERYKNAPNIIWLIGGDTYGDRNTEVWQALAHSIKKHDTEHLMSFHPFGRTTSAIFFHTEEWLDFNMFQSGHRRYGQVKGDGADNPISNIEEDNWRYVESCLGMNPKKPVLDGEPIYEDIPQGLHNPQEPHWTADDVRRYAYWSVFAGSFGHTYGHNNIMQFIKPGFNGAYGANGSKKAWYTAMEDPGFNQMKHLKQLMLTFPYFTRIPDQAIIAGKNGERYDRLIATRGDDYLLVYNYSGCPMNIDLTRISGSRKNVWWYNPQDGTLSYIGEFDNKITPFSCEVGYNRGNDRVLIAVDTRYEYLQKDWTVLPSNYQGHR